MNQQNFFNFFPVGQGLFYCGFINDGRYSFVYDCGTETSGVSLTTYISILNKWNNNQQLDFVAISHFHRDHVNGIKNLEKMIGFKKIYLPYISDDPLVYKFIISLSMLSDLSDNIEILPEEQLGLLYYLFELYERDTAIKVSDGLSFIVDYWEFKFFNKSISKQQENKLAIEISNLMAKYNVYNIEDLVRKCPIKEIRRTYDNVFGRSNINDTSLVLLHYPLPIYKSWATQYCSNCRYPYKTENEHCFYPYTILTGDINFDAATAKRIILNYPTGVSGFVQVPHHGSKYNWPSLIHNFPPFNCYIVNYGTTNTYGHPDPLLKSVIPTNNYFDNNEYAGFCYWIY